MERNPLYKFLKDNTVYSKGNILLMISLLSVSIPNCKIKEIKIRSRPTKYIATSSVPVKQLECFAV